MLDSRAASRVRSAARVELRHLRYFVAVAEELHFGRAANRLHIVQPALSKQIISLERELGFELLDRSHAIRLTRAGEVFYEEAHAILLRVDRAVQLTRATARGEAGTLAIGFIGPAMWSVLPAILREHRRRHPDLHFRIHELGSSEQLELLRDGTLDVGFVRSLVLDDVLVFEPVWRENFVIALPDDHRLAAVDAVDLAELQDETFIVLPRPNAPGVHDLHVGICLSYGFSPKTIEEGNSPAALNMVAMGLGVALIPASLERANLKGMVCRPLDRPTPTIDLTVSYQRENATPTLAAFLETVRSAVPGVDAPGRPVTLPSAPS